MRIRALLYYCHFIYLAPKCQGDSWSRRERTEEKASPVFLLWTRAQVEGWVDQYRFGIVTSLRKLRRRDSGSLWKRREGREDGGESKGGGLRGGNYLYWVRVGKWVSKVSPFSPHRRPQQRSLKETIAQSLR